MPAVNAGTFCINKKRARSAFGSRHNPVSIYKQSREKEN